MASELVNTYFVIGTILGYVCGFLSFLGIWFWSIRGSLVFGILGGWIPGGLVAFVVFWLLAFGWVLIAAAAIVFVILLLNHSL
jgi:hypothetical protein